MDKTNKELIGNFLVLVGIAINLFTWTFLVPHNYELAYKVVSASISLLILGTRLSSRYSD